MDTKVKVDLIANRSASGEIANQLQKEGSFNISKKKPYLNEDDIPCITVFKGGDPTKEANYMEVYAATMGLNVNVDTTLRPDEWEELDNAVTEISREELTVYDYFIGQNLTLVVHDFSIIIIYIEIKYHTLGNIINKKTCHFNSLKQ